MNPAPTNDNAYGYSRGAANISYSARRPSAPARPPVPESYTYLAPVSAYRVAAARDQRWGLPRSLWVPGVGVLATLVLLSILGANWLAGPAGARLSRYQNPLIYGVTLVAGLTDSPANVLAAAADAAAPRANAGRAPVNPATLADPARPAVAHHTPNYSLLAPPSISAAAIDAVLDSYHSPAAGSGATFYDLGVKYGIDPAYALAFYIHESAAGTKGVSRFTHGIGNIRTTPGYKDYEGYRSYDTYAAGIEDWFKLIKDLYIGGWGLTTPDTILLRYAPWGDNNNPTVYADTVKQLVDSWQAK